MACNATLWMPTLIDFLMPENTAKSRYQLAGSLYSQSKFDQALAILNELLTDTPDAAPLHYHRARCLVALDRNEEAGASFNTVIRLAPDYLPALIERIALARNNGESHFVPGLVNRLLDKDPDNPFGLFWLAEIKLASLSEDAEHQALALLDKSLALNPNIDEALALRAELAQQRALETDNITNEADLVTDTNGLSYQRAHLEAALRDYLRASEIKAHKNTRYLSQITRLAAQLSQYELARKYYQLHFSNPRGLA